MGLYPTFSSCLVCYLLNCLVCVMVTSSHSLIPPLSLSFY